MLQELFSRRVEIPGGGHADIGLESPAASFSIAEPGGKDKDPDPDEADGVECAICGKTKCDHWKDDDLPKKPDPVDEELWKQCVACAKTPASTSG